MTTDLSVVSSPANRRSRVGTAFKDLLLATLAIAAAALVVSLLITPVVRAQAKTELRIGYQKSASLFLLQKAQGSLEKRLVTQNVSVKWVEFPAGPQLLEGLNLGAVDVGYVGEAPPFLRKLPEPTLSTLATTLLRLPPRPFWCQRARPSRPWRRSRVKK